MMLLRSSFMSTDCCDLHAHQFDFDRLLQGVGAAAGEEVGVDAQAAQHCHAVLGGLGLLLPHHP